jgi:hypothetical protein
MLNRNLLIAVSFNANNGIVHLTYTLVEEENNVNWRWSLLCLKQQIINDCTSIYIIPDMHIDIKNGMEKIWPELVGYHWYCAQTLQAISIINLKICQPKRICLRCVMNHQSINLMYSLLICA